ncbi:MAG: PCMD domain-containing protein [Paludibacteraceae bacterium]|nr:PCMD domain-containing protein [Paludibacteraceae bacterium]
MQLKLHTLPLLLLVSSAVSAQIEPIRYGDFESWGTRHIKESGLIGGAEKTIYVIGPKCNYTTEELAPYDYKANTQWTSSNVYANVIGIVKASCSVTPEKRDGGGTCCRMDTKLDGVKVLGMVSVHVLISGSIFTGQTIEPIKGSKDPYCNLDFGIPFTRKPKALVLDYKCKISQRNSVEKWPGVGHKCIKNIQDKAEFWIYLQKRWEDADGNIHALRIGTAREQLDHDVPDWQNGHRVEIHYGDITKTPYYKDFMALNGPYRALNSKGEVTPIIEEGWGDANDTPTHVIVMLTAGNQGAFIGTLGNTLWIDNVKWDF